jgi:hypothetical protein
MASPEPPNSAGKSFNLGEPSRRLEVWLLVQNHLKRNPSARVVIDWMREIFEEFAEN